MFKQLMFIMLFAAKFGRERSMNVVHGMDGVRTFRIKTGSWAGSTLQIIQLGRLHTADNTVGQATHCR
jgi:hypothetical protein